MYAHLHPLTHPSTNDRTPTQYRVMHALYGHGVPVPKMFCFCNDDSVIGMRKYIHVYL